MMRWRRVLTGSLLVLGTAAPARAECAGPELDVMPRVVASQASVTVEGRGWNLCNDTPSGCSIGDLTPPQGRITVEVVPATPSRWDDFRSGGNASVGEDAVLSASTETDENGDWGVSMATDVPAGDYFLVATGTGAQTSTLLVYSRTKHGPD